MMSATKSGIRIRRAIVSAFGSWAWNLVGAAAAVTADRIRAVPPLNLPGFVNAHSHAFQRALRGRTEGADFWDWRSAMLDIAERLAPGDVRSGYGAAYREMLAAGYTAVGEFHYLGFDEALAAADGAQDAGVELTLLYAAYGRGGIERFRQDSAARYLADVERLRARGLRVGVAPHSVRACPAGWLEEIGAYAEREGLVLHVHADEQPREIEECVAEHGIRPIELLARTGCLGPRTTVVHATHASDHELDLVRDAGARVCICPTTEANLGDGFAPIDRLCERGIGVCIGSDSNVRIDPLEELRELEGIARRLTLRRNVISVDRLLAFGSDEGGASLGLESWGDVAVDTTHASLRGIEEADLLPALVFGCSAEVLAPAQPEMRQTGQ
jgi:formimidoylglutamate deiminase